MATYTLRDKESGTEVTVRARDDAAAIRAAHRWAREGDYRAECTLWVDTLVIRHRRGGQREAIDTVTTEIQPEAPKCSAPNGHEWRVVSARTNGGGMVYSYECTECGCMRTVDTWAIRPDTGERGLESILYEEARSLSAHRTPEAWWLWHDASYDRCSDSVDEAEARCAAWVAGESDYGPDGPSDEDGREDATEAELLAALALGGWTVYHAAEAGRPESHGVAAGEGGDWHYAPDSAPEGEVWSSGYPTRREAIAACLLEGSAPSLGDDEVRS